MGCKIKPIRRPLTDEDPSPESARGKELGRKDLGGEYMNGIVQKISLEHVSLEERRQEAKKPLYLVRYE